MKRYGVLFFGLFICFSLNALNIQVVNKNSNTALVKYTKKKFLRGFVDAWYALPSSVGNKTFSLSDSQDFIMIEVGGRRFINPYTKRVEVDTTKPLYKGATFWVKLLNVDGKAEWVLNVRCLINNYRRDNTITERNPYKGTIEQFAAQQAAEIDFFDIPLENHSQESVILTVNGRGSEAYAEVKVYQNGKEEIYRIPKRKSLFLN